MAATAEQAYEEAISAGHSVIYAKAYASKISEGEVFARHFAVIRERRSQAKQQAQHAVETKPSEAPYKSKPLTDADRGKVGSASPAQPPDTPADEPELAASPAAVSEDVAHALRKRTPDDFVLLKPLGEGSYSTVMLAEEKESGRLMAIKILEKSFIIKEKKTKYVMTEKDAFNALDHPFIVKLYYTYSDAEKLYYVLSYAENGELLRWIKKLGSFDETCTRFYSAEMVLALEHMHSRNIIHRDLKPENVLLDKDMHVQITDFGTAKILKGKGEVQERANSFVGTAQYVSPELLTEKSACKSSDLWALGCMIYQLMSGRVPFHGGNEYQTFKKITACEYGFPDGFPLDCKDLVSQLLRVEPNERLGCDAQGGFEKLKAHSFFEGIDWENLHKTNPPKLDAFLPARSPDDKPLHGSDPADDELADLAAAVYMQGAGSLEISMRRDEERKALLDRQARESPWHEFLESDELIIKTGLVDKRKGLFAKRRQLVLTDWPCLLYIDAENMIVKGEIPWSEDLLPQFKNMKTFFIHTPNRTYYLEDAERTAITWVDTIQQLQRLIKTDPSAARGTGRKRTKSAFPSVD